MYPPGFMQKISMKMNDQIFKAVHEIFKYKSEEYCLSYNTIKSIYCNSGDFVLKSKASSKQTNEKPNGSRLGDKGIKTTTLSSNIGKNNGNQL